jgi:hypothetical protein
MSCLLKMGGSSSSGCWLRKGSLQAGWLRSDKRDKSLVACGPGVQAGSDTRGVCEDMA